MIRIRPPRGRKEGAAVEWIVGDMRDFQLPTPVDPACVRSTRSMACTLSAISSGTSKRWSLVSDGIYVIGQSHQRDTNLIAYGPFHYEGQRDGCKVVLDWATDLRTHTLSQTAAVEIVIRVEDHGAHIEQRDRTVKSLATPVFLAAAARLSAVLEPFAWYGAWRLDQPYDDAPASTNCITVFRKLPTPELQRTSRWLRSCVRAEILPTRLIRRVARWPFSSPWGISITSGFWTGQAGIREGSRILRLAHPTIRKPGAHEACQRWSDARR